MISMPGNLMQIISLRFVREYSLQFVIILCMYSLYVTNISSKSYLMINSNYSMFPWLGPVKRNIYYLIIIKVPHFSRYYFPIQCMQSLLVF